jgi:hypothetical protein
MISEPTFSPPSTTLKSNPRASPRLLLGLIENLGILESWEPPYPPISEQSPSTSESIGENI